MTSHGFSPFALRQMRNVMDELFTDLLTLVLEFDDDTQITATAWLARGEDAITLPDVTFMVEHANRVARQIVIYNDHWQEVAYVTNNVEGLRTTGSPITVAGLGFAYPGSPMEKSLYGKP